MNPLAQVAIIIVFGTAVIGVGVFIARVLCFARRAPSAPRREYDDDYPAIVGDPWADDFYQGDGSDDGLARRHADV